jgi:hypothetical protein
LVQTFHQPGVTNLPIHTDGDNSANRDAEMGDNSITGGPGRVPGGGGVRPVKELPAGPRQGVPTIQTTDLLSQMSEHTTSHSNSAAIRNANPSGQPIICNNSDYNNDNSNDNPSLSPSTARSPSTVQVSEAILDTRRRKRHDPVALHVDELPVVVPW